MSLRNATCQIAALICDWDAAIRQRYQGLRCCDVGLVVGGSDSTSIALNRKVAGNEKWIICPEVDIQGGNLEDLCQAGFNDAGSGILIAITMADSVSADQNAAALSLKNTINALRNKKICVARPVTMSAAAASNDLLGEDDGLTHLLSTGALQFGEFTLKSGRISPYFFNSSAICSGKSLMEIGR
jgi:hypothetical protein